MEILLAIVGIGGALATLVALIVLHALPTGLSPLRDPVSAYGISRWRSLYRVQTIGTAVSAAALAVLLTVQFGSAATAAALSLAVLAVARLVISWFPMDASGAARTRTGRLHNLFAFGAFAAASVSGFMVAIALSADAATADLSSVASTLGWIMTVASVITIVAGVARPLAGIFGLAERLIYVGMLALLGFAPIVVVLNVM